VSELGADTPPVDKPKDPLVRFLWGCALVAALFAALVVGLGLAIGWQLTRDKAPGRPVEALLLGDETRYWRVDLTTDDPGLTLLLQRFNEINDERRRALLHGTFLEHLPIPSRKARLSEIAPLTLELALVMSDPGDGPPTPVAWTARGTVSGGVMKLKMRAALKVLGWVTRPGAKEGGPVDVDGISVTRIGPGVALASVGDRVIATNDAARMRSVLESTKAATSMQDPRLASLHESARTPGEDAWGFATDLTVGDPSPRKPVGLAVASFDVNDADELRFEVAVADGGVFDGTPEACRDVASAFLPHVPKDAIDIDPESARVAPSGSRTFTGRISGLSKRFAALAELRSSPRFRETERPVGGSRSPSAIPSPPSRPPPADPRSGTPSGPRREETPKPPR